MVGVPTSRGCQACRKQKKRCLSTNEKPPCERCRRLNISCLELGQQRLKFQSENDRLSRLARKTQTISLDATPSNATSTTTTLTTTSINPPPSSTLTYLRAAYIRAISGTTSLAYHLPWNYGPYLEQVPLHLGQNDALDMAVQALYEGYFTLRRGQKPGRDRNCLRRYSEALKALAGVLDERKLATSTETLCAISMLIVFESISGFAAKSVLAHAGGAARIFKERQSTTPKNELEAMLQLSLRGSIVMQALFLPPHYFTDAEWVSLTESQIGAESPEEQAFRCMAVYARLLHRAQAIFDKDIGTISQIQRLLADAEALHDRLEPHLVALRETFWELTDKLRYRQNQDPGGVLVGHSPWDLSTHHAHIGRSYGFAIAAQVLINCLIQASRHRQNIPSMMEKDRILIRENADLAREACQLARAVDCHRPLGTIYVARVLYLVSIAAEGAARNSEEVTALNSLSAMTTWWMALYGADPEDVRESEDSYLILDDDRDVEYTIRKTTVTEDIKTLIESHLLDLEEPAAPGELDITLKWMKARFTFTEMQVTPEDMIVANRMGLVKEVS